MPTFRQDTKIGGMVPMMKTDDINDQAITKDKIRDGNVTAEKLADGAVSTDKLPDGAIKTPKIADENITTSKLAEASVVTSKIADQNVTKEKIADQSVDNSKLSPEAVTYDKLKDKSVITEKLNDRAVTTEKVEEKAITNAKIGDSAVDGRTIGEASVEKKHLANDSVATEKLQDSSVTSDKIHTNAVTGEKIEDSAISNPKLADNSVGTSKIKDGNVTNEKVANNTLTIDKFDPELRKSIQAATGLPENLVEVIQDVDVEVKSLHSKDEDLQSQITDKQKQITSNDKDIQSLQNRSTQMEQSINNIAVTGGASVANTVTYSNTASGLVSINAQGAIDELAAKNATKAEKAEVTAELEKKFDKESILQESGDSDDKVMSQKAVSTKLSDLSEMDKNLNNSINKTHERQKYLANVFEGIKANSSNESGTFKDGIITVAKGNTFFEFFSSIHVEAYKGYMLIGKITALQDIESEKFEVYIGGDNHFDFTGRICKFVANSRNSKDYILQLGIINSTTDGKQFKVDYIYMIPQILYYEGIFDDLEAGIYTAYKSLTSVDAQEQKKIQELLNTKFNKEIKNNRLLSSQNYLQGFNILKGFDFENASSVIGKQTISDYIITIENNDTADRFNLEDFIGDKDINNYGFVAKITALQGNNPPVYPVLKGESTKTFGFNKDNACYIDFKTEKEGSLLGFGIGVFPSDELRVSNKYRIDFLFIIPQELIYDGLAKDISENKPVSYRAVGTETLLKKDIDSINGDITNIKNQLSREDETSYKCYCWGDSLTWGAGSSHSYAHYLNQLNLGVKFVTCGVGGEGSDAISFRQGANAGYLTKNITIPSTLDKIDLGTSFIRLDFGTPGILLQGEGRVDEAGIATVNPININGIDCTLSFDTSTSGAQFGQYGTDHYKLNRVDVGNEVTIKAGTLVTLAGNKFKNCYMNIYWVGTNDDGLPASDLLTRIEKMIDYNGNGRYLVIGFHTSIESGLSIIQERNKTLKDRFGNRFIDELSYMVNCGIDDALSRGYITGSYPREEDAAAISKNVVPPVFLHDAIHYNEIGYHLIADKIAERIKVLGLNLA